ncbi:MAG: glutaredoxin family protein [Patescibacteria group bacterium]|nr:glutaredoxin family protein [Patescibacteria group bacterium]
MPKNVTVYSTPTCHFCAMAKEYLKEKGVDFKEINVAQNQAAAKMIVEKTKQLGVPVIEIDGQFIPGFDPEKIDELLK